MNQTFLCLFFMSHDLDILSEWEIQFKLYLVQSSFSYSFLIILYRVHHQRLILILGKTKLLDKYVIIKKMSQPRGK
jgi:hypothetical protein